MKKSTGRVKRFCAELVGNCLYVAAAGVMGDFFFDCICCYDIVNNDWSRLPQIPDSPFIKVVSLCHIEDHLYVISNSSAHYRFNLTTNQWQPIASSEAAFKLGQETSSSKAAAVYKSCLYVLYDKGQIIKYTPGIIYYSRESLSALFRFDPKKNRWEQKASTKTPHSWSSLLVVGNNLCVAGGRCSFQTSFNAPGGCPAGDLAAIEVYNDQENAWSVVKQTHIPRNNLGAVEIDGRVYFIINSFPVDSGIRIPPGEVYPVILDEWKKLGNIEGNAVLCYVPLNTEHLTTENE